MPRFRRSKRRFSRRRRGGLKRFAKRIARIGSEPKKIEIVSNLANVLRQGDGTSREVVIMNLPSNLIQGTGEANFIGNHVWLKGVGIKFNATISVEFSMFYIRWILFTSRANAIGMTGAGAVYNSTTDDDTQPAQTANTQFRNPRIFDSAAANPAPFVGISYATQLDRTNIHVIRTKTIQVNQGGSGSANRLVKFFMPIKRGFQFQNPDDSALTAAPNHGKYGSIYLAYQVFADAGAANIAVTQLGIMDLNIDLYFRDA